MARILIIEDDEVIARGMARHLETAGFDTVGVANEETGLARLRYERPDVCVLDLMLPGIDGWRVIEQARDEGIGTPIVVVSARGIEHDRVHALEIGADDYLVKPFSMKELAARVRAAARRGVSAAEQRRGDTIVIEELGSTSNNAGIRRRGERGAHSDGVPPPVHARAGGGPGAHPGRAAPAGVGPPGDAPRPDGRRLRAQAAREGRPPRLAARLHPHPVRRRLQARGAGRSLTRAARERSGSARRAARVGFRGPACLELPAHARPGGPLGVPVAFAAGLFQTAIHDATHVVWEVVPDWLGRSEPHVVRGPRPRRRRSPRGCCTPPAGSRWAHAARGARDGRGLPRRAAGILLAALATLAFGLVLGPEAPLIALGLALGAATVRLVTLEQTEARLLALAGAFAAIAALFGGPW